ncbi:hypothetical protein ACFPIF_10365 [Brevundimonas faecalis]|uniref:hypothetical protein n=1 Tax=Brevundimonas faecalis TaxID=947378 RepID=UPI003610CAC4
MHPVATDRLFDAARAKGVRHRSAPIVRSRIIVGALGDPRTVPFHPRRVLRPFVLTTALQFLVCAGIVGLFWWALS